MAVVAEHQEPGVSIVTKVGALPVSIAPLLPFVGWLLGGGIFHWITPIVLFGFGIALDHLIGDDLRNVPAEQEARYEKSLYYRLTLWLFWPMQAAVVIFSYYLITQTPMALHEQIGLALSMAIAVGFGATLGHELCHHGNRLDRVIGVNVLALCGMANFLIYHNYGHHKVVATPDDPASARFGQTFWSFTVPNIWGKFVMSWRIEAERLRQRGDRPLSRHNLMIWLTALELAWVTGLTLAFGWLAIALFALQWITPRALLSVGDYLEHYGLARRRLPNGEYEAPRAVHSWDDAHVVSSLLFTVVDRHSDHHENSGRPFQILRARPEAARLPHGYLTMVFVALVPALWRRMVDPIAIEFYERGEVVPHAVPGALPEHLREGAYVY